MLKIPSTRINSRMDMYKHGLSQPFKGLGEITAGLTGIRMRWLSVSSFSIGAECIRGFK